MLARGKEHCSRRVAVVLGCGFLLSFSPEESRETSAKLVPDPAIAAVVERVIDEARHPWLRWPVLADVAPDLAELYGLENDRLVWFEGGDPHPGVASAIEAVGRAAEFALKPSDYDARRIREEWSALQTAPPREGDGEDRALFDLAVSVGVLREIQAVHSGRVDPRTLDWGFDVSPKKLARTAILREARDAAGVPALLEGLEPAFPHYQRNRRMLAHHRRLAETGEAELVPPLPEGRRKVSPGEPWPGVAPLRARLALFGDLEEDAPIATAAPARPFTMALSWKR
jgi:L,D-transpeptidase YcbB